ncbi:hypothetical protein [Burkholderia sp. 572]|uniref:hypothetical protein n=1 Tax=Burkholderia sp. 572 TaxID=3156414 RepID=UPI0033995637
MISGKSVSVADDNRGDNWTSPNRSVIRTQCGTEHARAGRDRASGPTWLISLRSTPARVSAPHAFRRPAVAVLAVAQAPMRTSQAIRPHTARLSRPSGRRYALPHLIGLRPRSSPRFPTTARGRIIDTLMSVIAARPANAESQQNKSMRDAGLPTRPSGADHCPASHDTTPESQTLQRSPNLKGRFLVTSDMPASVLFTIDRPAWPI